MRKMVLPLLSVATLALAGCNSSSPSQQAGSGSPVNAASASTAKIPSDVSGTISLRAGSAQPSSKATMVINLVDVSSTAAGAQPLASKSVVPVGQFPQSFQLSFDPTQVKTSDLYVVKVVLTDGDRHYAMPIQAPVLTKGNKNIVSISLVAEQTPGEKLLSEFKAEQAQLGAMKVSHGTKLEKDASRGWQLFRQDGKVKFIRGLVDYVDKRFTSTDYAYKDGKPWVIVQESRSGGRSGKLVSIDRAGWADNGTLVLKEHQVGKDVQELDSDTAAKLQKQASEILSIATHGKNK